MAKKVSKIIATESVFINAVSIKDSLNILHKKLGEKKRAKIRRKGINFEVYY